MAVAMFVQMKAYAGTEDASEYHARIRAAVADIPMRFGAWDGVDIPVPAPAAKLLRPNVLFARRYENQQTGHSVSVVLVHCRDSRDMCGHYPPNCYPSSGWTQLEPYIKIDLHLNDKTIPAAVYNFTRTELDNTTHAIVYNFFILPDAFVTRMSEVQKASGRPEIRPYGAAQVQIVMDSRDRSRSDIAEELLKPLAPIIALLQEHAQGGRS